MPTFMNFYRLILEANVDKPLIPPPSEMSVYDSDFIEVDPSPLATQAMKMFAEIDCERCGTDICDCEA